MAEPVNAMTQYGDLKGEAQMDGHNGPMLHKICNDKGISLDGLVPIGLNLWRFDSPSIDGLYCNIIRLPSHKAGMDYDLPAPRTAVISEW